jgi:phosphoglycerate dehydrogenase-like enzyme
VQLFFLLRNTALQQRSLNSGLWRNMTNPGQELISKKIGIIGCGAIGKLLARNIQEFGS